MLGDTITWFCRFVSNKVGGMARSCHPDGDRSGLCCKVKLTDGIIQERARLLPEALEFMNGATVVCRTKILWPAATASLPPSAEEAILDHGALYGSAFVVHVAPEFVER